MKRRFYYRTNRLSVSALAIVLASVGMAAAQSNPESYNSPPGPFHQPIPPYPVEMGFSQHHSSTLQEGWQRGRAAIIQAFGNYQISASQAAILREQARWMDRENDLKLRAARERFEQERAEQKIEGQKKLVARRATVYRQTYQLSAHEFDRSTGEINWPAVLQDAKYQQDRERIGELFRTHVGYGEPQPATANAIATSINSLARVLRNDLSNVPREEYLAGQKFLLGLKYEAQSLVEAS